jgi:hypothetical protein
MKKGKYFISEFKDEYFFHGGVGIIDAESILEREGFVPIRQPFANSYSIRSKVYRLVHSLKVLYTIERDAVVVFIHPLYARLDRWLVAKLAKKKRKLICFVGDIDGLKDGNPRLLQQEIRFFQKFNYFILHNQSMTNWFKQQIPGKICEQLQFFDFHSQPIARMRMNNGNLVFAGNLDKSRFLEQLDGLPIRFNLYGPGATEQMLSQSNIQYHGVIDPYELPQKLEGSYGLVWDGDSISEMKGSIGEYMQFVSHHKLSLYILAGLPIIIFRSAGAASLVQQYQIGLCIDRLEEIGPKINSISATQYQQMVNNMKPLAKKIASGNWLSEALQKLMERIH